MFYAHFVLAKKGPLARIWLAAHWDKKLTKAHVFETNIESSVEGILQPKVKMALRTSGHLLLGIVRIYSRKAKYLLADCNEAFIKIKMAFRPGAVDLPEEGRQAALSTITLPEVFHDFETAMPDLSNIDMEAAVTLNQSRAEDITLKEDYGSLSLMNDDGFDMGFDDPEMAREATNIDEAFDQASLLLGGSMLGRPSEAPRGGAAGANEAGASSSSAVADSSTLGALPVPGDSIEVARNTREGDAADPFGTAAATATSAEAGAADEAREGALLEGEPSGLFEPAGLFDDAPLGHVPLDTSGSDRDVPLGAPGPAPAGPDTRPVDESDDDDMYDMGPASMGAPSGPSSPGSSVGDAHDLDEGATTSAAAGLGGPSSSSAMPSADGGLIDQQQQEQAVMPPPPRPPSVDVAQMGATEAGPGEQTTLLNNEDESFALAPLDTTVIQGVEKARAKRKRKLIVDEVKNISGEEMKAQLSDTSDIVTTLDLAPPTKRLMHWKETGGVEKLFALPGRPILSRALSRLYQRHLTTRAVENELAAGEDPLLQQLDDEQQDVEQPQHEEQQQMHENSLGHHTKRRRLEDDLIGPQNGSEQQQQPSSHYDLGAPDFPHGAHMGGAPQDPYGGPMVAPGMVPPPPPEYQQPQPQTPLQDGWPTPADYTYAQPPPPHTPVHDYAAAYQMQQQQQMASMMGHPMTPVHQQQQLPPPPHLEEEHHHPHLQGHHHQSAAAAALFPTLQPDQLQSEYPVHPATPVPAPQSPPAAMMPPTPQMGPPPTPQMMPPPTPQMQPPQEETSSMEPMAPPSEFDALVASGPALHGFGAPIEAAAAEQHQQQLSEAEPQPELEPHPMTEEEQQEQRELAAQQDQLAQLDDDDEDYGPPASVGPAEEQLADETYEQFEERILNKRTVHMLHMIRTPLEAGRQVRFSDVARGSNRKQVAQKFYTFLVLKKQQAVELQQEAPFAELFIERGPKFEQSLL
ncbi:RAD21 cohesin complex component verthandi isoform X2 [Amblyomma americanum]